MAGGAGSRVSAEKAAVTVYRLDFTLEETEGRKEVSARKYSLLVMDRGLGKINTGARIPYFPDTRDKQVHMAAVGVVIECKVQDVDPQVQLDCAFESSAMAPEQPARAAAGLPPVMHTMQSHVVTRIPAGRATVVSALDDPATKHHLEVLVTATKL